MVFQWPLLNGFPSLMIFLEDQQTAFIAPLQCGKLKIFDH